MAKKKKENTRHIPNNVSNDVKKMHHFQCAWCCNQLTERHHIEEFSNGGMHTVENLILLCPICHTKVHKGIISKSELIKRKLTHFKSDRISANFTTTIEKLKYKIGGAFYFDCENLLKYRNEKILNFELRNNQLLINLKFFNQEGALVFWMSENYYWFSSVFKIENGLDYLEIKDKKECFIFKMEKIDDYLKIRLKTFVGGKVFDFDENIANMGGMQFKGGEIHVNSKNVTIFNFN